MPAQSRVSVFDQYLRANAIPIDGLSVASSPPGPETVTIQFQASATQEQIDWANAALASFDWRPRQFLTTGTIVSTIAGLTQQQQQVLYRWVVANWIKDNEAKVLEALATLGFALPYDEVAP